MNKIKIGFDYNAKRIDDLNRPKKASYQLELEQFFDSYSLQFNENDSNYTTSFKEQFDVIHKKNFPEFVSLDKRLELSEIDFGILDDLEQFYKAIPKIYNEKDYTIYATSERQIEAFNLAHTVLDLIKQIESFYGTLSQKTYNELTISLRGIITIDKRTSERCINVNRIKNV